MQAGPYFNSTGTEVGDLSKSAVKNLSDARIALIQMLSYLDAGDTDKAYQNRGNAIELLRKAIGGFIEIEKRVPNQPILLKARPAEEQRIVDEFTATLQRRKLEVPKTQTELAHLAVVIVSAYEQSVEKANLQGFPKQWQGARQIILSEIEVLEVGNLASIIWTISP